MDNMRRAFQLYLHVAGLPSLSWVCFDGFVSHPTLGPLAAHVKLKPVLNMFPTCSNTMMTRMDSHRSLNKILILLIFTVIPPKFD